MYKPVTPVLLSGFSEGGWITNRFHLYSNGSHVRFDDGHRLKAATDKDERIVSLLGGDPEGFFHGEIEDTLLVERVKRYWNEYFEVRLTNCSSFAHYLTTGDFVECEDKHRLLVIEQGMRPYEMASRVDVGDMVCLFYAKERKLQSRKEPYSRRYRRAKKKRHDSGAFTCAAAMELQPRSFSPEEIRRIHRGPWVDDFHFMVCVAKWRDEPIWLSQDGFSRPGEKDVSYFSLTRGEKDSYPFGVPMLSFIKKRRTTKAA